MLTVPELMLEVQDQIDTAGATYAEEAVGLLARGGTHLLDAAITNATRRFSKDPLRLFVLSLAMQAHLHPRTPVSRPRGAER